MNLTFKNKGPCTVSEFTCWAEPALRPVVLGVVDVDWVVVVVEGEVRRLVALVVRPGQRHGRQQVEGQLPVGLRVVNL